MHFLDVQIYKFHLSLAKICLFHKVMNIYVKMHLGKYNNKVKFQFKKIIDFGLGNITIIGEHESGFKEKSVEYATFIKTHYLRNTLFFYVGCLCAIVGGSYMYCIVIIFGVVVEKVIEIYAVHSEVLWLAYIGYTLSSIVNYINIISAIINTYYHSD